MRAPDPGQPASAAVEPLRRWFRGRGWTPFPYQEEAWGAYLDGEEGLIHVETGLGKTLAAAGGPLLSGLADGDGAGGLRLLWITPLRALARDTVAALREAVDGLGLSWGVELRTGDVSSGVKARQRKQPPQVLVTTPESLSLLLSYPERARIFGRLASVVVDEWHELLGTKRGIQTELGVSYLRSLRPGVRVWGLSATLGNLDEARDALLGPDRPGRLVRGPRREAPAIETLIPDEVVRFPWSGHLGLQLLPQVADELARGGTALLFTNTRAQAELWHQALVGHRPEWRDQIGLHHGSLDRRVREEAEEGLATGRLRCVVCTSSLDLGVDFQPVDRVLQVGSPKGVGRLLQRIGRSGHRPGAPRRIVCVPTHALELVEFAAAREAIAQGQVEPRPPLSGPLDVLAQHVVTLAVGGGVSAHDLKAQLRTTASYRDLSDEAWEWVLDFVIRGGSALQAYPRYRRVVRDADGTLRPASTRVGRSHRQTVGTITDDGALEVRFLKGGRLGTVEESFLARLRPGERFLFAGRMLELVRIRDMRAYVRRARGRKGMVPRWAGGRLPLSSHLATWVAAALAGAAGTPRAVAPEMQAVAPLLELQARWSRLPGPDTLLMEFSTSREGHHLFLFPFLGRLSHEGLGTLLAYRLSRLEPRSVGVTVNDYGLELLSPEPFPDDVQVWRALLSARALGDELTACLNAAELAKRRFREIARVSGLVHPGPPGRSRGARNLQASSGLIYDVLARYDPDNLLVRQARAEVLERELEVQRLRDGLVRLADRPLLMTRPERFTPLAFPIWAERLQAQVSSESWVERVERMARKLEEAAA